MTTQHDRTTTPPSSSTIGGLAGEFTLALAFAFLAASAGCGSKAKPATTTVTPTAPALPRPPAARPPAAPAQSATIAPETRGSEPAPSMAPIRFDFDSAELSQAARDDLRELAGWMARNAAARVSIEGHADERGATEYNLALGQQRAEAIARFLERLGIDRGRRSTISYGEERSALEGDDEAAWAANRRGELSPR
jgi:peptidoglycan-associated lipoprotein